MMGMAKRTVSHALFSWSDGDGTPRMALRGEEVELSGAELERAERLGAVVEGPLEVPGPTVPAPAPPVDADEAGKLLDSGPAPKAAPKSAAATKPKD